MSEKQATQNNPIYPIMIAIGVAHLINDTMQSVVPAMFPIFERDLGLSFTQLGVITFVLNMVSSALQPVIGFVSDKKPMPYALPIGMMSAFVGILMLVLSGQYWMIIIAVVFLGFGSAIFHPEGSRVSFMAAGNKRGLSQSIYQVGGNSGQALAPLISAFVLDSLGQHGAAIVLLLAAIGIAILLKISRWYIRQLEAERTSQKKKKILISSLPPLTKKQVSFAIILLLIIIFARSFYTTNITSFYVFYLMDHYGLTLQFGQVLIFIFMAFGVVGTFFGGSLSDRIGRKNVILLSVVVPMPFCLILPYMPLWLVPVVLIIIGTLIMISFSVTVIYAQELVPTKIGTMAGLTTGFAFGMGAIGGVIIGFLLDNIGIDTTMKIISFLPLILIVAFLLPKDKVEKLA
ncbi:Fosmidomycin resistance protein [Ureibacillus massiliensis 4400831 = CIP 108448 = CCUG 49529]|uniref:Fosmidomycin resistance protein n=1 Tax=Ureibacillus massiliensis 4400831 = CIP 108448 = CCUG 49529 TaxID=1211035 RepID=A0A0A3J9C1_9BACL|nr:MFS transporter [Ureibacillus massiliensis]KGR91763.1 Fosmidomycin resistance protein [Ureibacillus massiliensis 4400831 = CIP 108448 = CCUG 49529]